MTTCPQCENAVSPEDRYCGKCGYMLQRASDPPRRQTDHALDVVEVKFRLGVVYYKKDNIQAAVKLWKDVLNINPQHKGAREMLDQANSRQLSDE